jgi:hypothetical protein
MSGRTAVVPFPVPPFTGGYAPSVARCEEAVCPPCPQIADRTRSCSATALVNRDLIAERAPSGQRRVVGSNGC